MRANSVLFISVLLFLISCQREKVYCYYVDIRGAVDKTVYMGANIKQAEQIGIIYKYKGFYGSDVIQKEANKLGISGIPTKYGFAEIIRYYPKQNVVKVVYRRELTNRLGSPTYVRYVPMVLLHDTPPNDSVKYIDPQKACVIEILLSEEEKSFFARTYAGGQLEVEQSRIVYDKDRFPLEYVGTLNYKKANGELIKTGITVWSKAFPNPYSRSWETYLYRNQIEE